ncbi:protein of unknown function [Georgfuchsia toluolica]|uniref:Zona occludens toxin N-terminal domain-containing protein n=1 Tax=Georgfuchsia toluolica TaxID=424218 RepID=A0A916J4J2_9PROT|nr:zonular occludens toxin domain-containing protein [Georgfuchsia toluolica]CAG4883760.1 protein of unknown function [Georgfuchsia toluolica]
MADHIVTGKKGAGKTLFCAGVIRDALVEGRRVATNVDIYMDEICYPTSRKTIIRLPDRPTVHDMLAIGYGSPQDEMDESKNGVIVLDEASHFLNARAWGDKERQPLIDWLTLSRKYNWNTYFLAQGLGQIDKQVRDALIEYHISVKRTDKWAIPFVTKFTKLFMKDGVRFPKLHLGIMKHGMDRDALKVDTIWYRAKDLYNVYNTKQKLVDREHPESVGLHTVLSAWHIKGRYMPPAPPTGMELVKALVKGENPLVVRPVVPLKPKHPIVEIIMRLPPDERVRHLQRIERLKLLDRPRLSLVQAANPSAIDYRSVSHPNLKLVVSA